MQRNAARLMRKLVFLEMYVVIPASQEKDRK